MTTFVSRKLFSATLAVAMTLTSTTFLSPRRAEALFSATLEQNRKWPISSAYNSQGAE
ncbi:hypothetical protein [Agrobacterium pusense]|uniref:hypothetical protein n=1 Tax=Agrobacterium pusense TaxID=648995 RepID=UPI003FD5FA76